MKPQTQFVTQNKAQIFSRTILTQEELVTFLESTGIEFVIDDNTIKIRGQVYYNSWGNVSELAIITDDNKRIIFEEFLEENRISVETDEIRYYAFTFKNVKAYYSYPYLIIKA
jgi:hypothetical protein